ncbi:gliding motility-associated C-terminal domain-containing protein [Flagellimonas meridianipacifica]|uniref:Gliding motility-associated-like protein n=1 Tax=Flagellimonas meridianipacifica TaxID=1080225 RepID=A0A2T0MIA3_9FLAO|nr:gliding motility-associated C-terminal domain-containing protein [Allomuricauda pacifica]PRX57314.1 gliding motility-associated-like protein [Allomuricauda pacifica]
MPKSKFSAYSFLFLILFSCQNDDSSDGGFICCSNQIDGNVNNLENFPEFDTLDDITVFNWFTPNDDGLNDFFAIANIQQYENHRVEIFRLNGQMVYESEDYASGNLTTVFRGENLPEGSYEYRITIQDESVFLLRGFLCLIRTPQENFVFEPFCQSFPDPLIGNSI